MPTTALPVRGNYFAEADYLQADVNTGVVRNRAGTRLLCLSSDFLLGIRRALVTECGPAADLVMKSCGKTWGGLLARRLDSELTAYFGKPVAELPMADFEACLIQAFSHHGWGLPRFDWSHQDRGLVVVVINQAVYGTLATDAETPADALLAGILGAVLGHFSGQDLDCVQTRCLTRGDAESTFVVGLASRLASVENGIREGKNHEAVMEELARSRV